MILEFEVENYRSIKERTVFTMVADNYKSRSNNIYTHHFPYDDEVGLLTSAVIYGPNGSGKSNVLKALSTFVSFVRRDHTSAGEPIRNYDPFLFDLETEVRPVSFLLRFIGPGKIKYEYSIEYNHWQVLKEKLVSFPFKQPRILFDRISPDNPNEHIHITRLGSSLNNIEVKVFHNRPLLSKFGKEEPHEELTNIFVYFSNFHIVNSHLQSQRVLLKGKVNRLFKDNSQFNAHLNKLIQRSDIKINKVTVEEKDVIVENELEPEYKMRTIFSLFGLHDLYKDNRKIDERPLDFREESAGTNTLYLLGGKILEVLMMGGTLIVDELETSLHPMLSKMLVELFHSEEMNPKGAQLIFTTHDITLLYNSMFRRDQVWFTEKNNKGESELYSLQDFKDVREETPYDKWYMARKFGAFPLIGENDDSINSDAEAKS